MNEIKKLNSLILLSTLIIFSTWISIGFMIGITKLAQLEINKKLTKISQQQAETTVKIVKIRELLEMFEEAVPTGKEVIYLDEDEEDYLNNDLVTGDVE